MLPSLAISLLYQDGDHMAFLLSAAITLGAGFLLSLLKRDGAKMQARDGFATVGLTWIFLSLFGALPYVFSGVIPNYAEAVFETASGFTTTGASVLTFIEGQPRGILFWRGQTQWMGGVGVLVLALALFPKLGEGSVYLMRAESPGPIKSKLTPRLRDTAKILYTIYIGLTAAEVLCLCLAGMPLYDAVVHAFTTISTGGFSVKNASIGTYNSLVIDWIVIIFMFLSGINFSLLFAALRRNLKTVWHSEELRCYTVTTMVASGLIVVDLVVRAGRMLNLDTVTDAVFQMVTLMTTTGYMTDDYVLWPAFSQIVLIIVMLMGGCAGSTAGGIKHVRAVLLGKSLVRDLRRILHPRQVTTIKCDGGEGQRTNSLRDRCIFLYLHPAFNGGHTDCRLGRRGFYHRLRRLPHLPEQRGAGVWYHGAHRKLQRSVRREHRGPDAEHAPGEAGDHAAAAAAVPRTVEEVRFLGPSASHPVSFCLCQRMAPMG